MSYRLDEFAPGEIYHIYSRSVEKRVIFRNNQDRQRFLDLLIHCMPQGEVISYSTARKLKQPLARTEAGSGLIDLLCYCLMDNHFHLLVKENAEDGISDFMQRLLTSYAMYFNKSEERSGSLFTHPFRAALVDGDDYFLHVSRYIHLNPYVAHIIPHPTKKYWSSLGEYLNSDAKALCHLALLADMMSAAEYKSFIMDHAGYALSLADISHLLLYSD